MLENLSREIDFLFASAQLNAPLVMEIMVVLWMINIINWGSKSYFSQNFGLVPRSISGIPGIIFSVLWHDDFAHLLFNSIPLFILSVLLLNYGWNDYLLISGLIILIEGTAVWCFGRYANHIGASGLVSGYFGFIMVLAILSPTLTTWLLAIIAVYYFGGIFFSIFPTDDFVSWESHLCGFLAGCLVAYLFVLKLI